MAVNTASISILHRYMKNTTYNRNVMYSLSNKDSMCTILPSGLHLTKWNIDLDNGEVHFLSPVTCDFRLEFTYIVTKKRPTSSLI